MKKKVTTLFIIFLGICKVEAQTQAQLPWYQYGYSSCWAASAAYVSKKVSTTPTSQCEFIKIRDYNSLVCDCSNVWTSTILRSPFKDLVAKYITGYKWDTSSAMGLAFMKNHINTKRKPIIYNYGYERGPSHIVVLDNVEHNARGNLATALFNVKDPWPKCKGNEYYTTYERYFLQSQRPSNRESNYTLFFSSGTPMPSIALVGADAQYLQNVLYDTTEEGLVKKFLKSINPSTASGGSTSILSNKFFKVTNLPKDNIAGITPGQKFEVVAVGNGSTTFNQNYEISLNNLLNKDFDEKIICLIESNTIVRTFMSISKAKMMPEFPFNDKWIIYHIEEGGEFNQFFEGLRRIESSNITALVSSNNEGVVLRFADSIFTIYKNEDKHFVYDLYGDGFEKLGLDTEGRSVDFKSFNQAAINFINQ